MATQTCKQVSKQSLPVSHLTTVADHDVFTLFLKQFFQYVAAPSCRRKLPTELVACHRLSLTKVAEDSLSAIGKELMRRTREAICKQFGEDYK